MQLIESIKPYHFSFLTFEFFVSIRLTLLYSSSSLQIFLIELWKLVWYLKWWHLLYQPSRISSLAFSWSVFWPFPSSSENKTPSMSDVYPQSRTTIDDCMLIQDISQSNSSITYSRCNSHENKVSCHFPWPSFWRCPSSIQLNILIVSDWTLHSRLFCNLGPKSIFGALSLQQVMPRFSQQLKIL